MRPKYTCFGCDETRCSTGPRSHGRIAFPNYVAVPQAKLATGKHMIDHTNVVVSDFDRSKAFYTRALAPLGYALLMEVPKEFTGGRGVIGFGEPPRPDFWVSSGPATNTPTHIAFRANSRADVLAFYAEAIAAGGRDNGAPGLRPHYHATYFGAFVLDPDGHNVEAVCHAPE